MRCLYVLFISMLVLKKYFFGGKQLSVLPPWLHRVCDVAKASLLYSVNLPMTQK